MPPAKTGAKTTGDTGEKIARTDEGDWEEIAPFTEPITMSEGDEIIALYLGGNEVEVPARDDDKDESVTTLENGKRVRRAMLYEFRNDGESEPFGLWGSAVLDKNLAEVPANSRVKIRYDGLAQLDGGRTARRYRVWVDKSAKF